MKSFKINERIEIVCESKNTRNGFKHEATLLINGEEVDSAKCCYLNRTWERYTYQSVLSKIVDKTDWLNDEDKTICREFISGDHSTYKKEFKTVSAIAQLGEVFCNNQKDKNDWKARMLKAGLEHKGLQIPEDWDSLSEDTKEARLNKVIECMGGNK